MIRPQSGARLGGPLGVSGAATRVDHCGGDLRASRSAKGTSSGLQGESGRRASGGHVRLAR